MGRVKLKIKRLENTNGRQTTYAKRKNGIMKKASELSILCDIDMILLMFSPGGKPSLCRGRHSNLEEVIAKFAQQSPQERAKRKLECLEALKKTFKKIDHDVNIQEFIGTSGQSIEDLSNHTKLLYTQISEIQKRLSQWTDIDNINSVEQLGQMENSLRESLIRIQTHKEDIKNQQFISLQCNNQFHEMNIPFKMSAEHLQLLPWINNGDNQHMVLPEDSNFFLHKDVEGSTSSSFGSYASYLGSSCKTEISNSGPENCVLSSSDMSVAAPVRLQQLNGGQFPHLPTNFNLLDNLKFEPAPTEINPHDHNPVVDCHGGNENMVAPTPPGYDPNTHGWSSTSRSCVSTMFDDHLYAQQPN